MCEADVRAGVSRGSAELSAELYRKGATTRLDTRGSRSRRVQSHSCAPEPFERREKLALSAPEALPDARLAPLVADT